MKKRSTVLLSVLLLLGACLTSGYSQYSQDNKGGKPETDAPEGPQIGQAAPDFELPWADQTAIHTARDEWVKLSGLRGTNVILAFYAADWTGG